MTFHACLDGVHFVVIFTWYCPQPNTIKRQQLYTHRYRCYTTKNVTCIRANWQKVACNSIYLKNEREKMQPTMPLQTKMLELFGIWRWQFPCNYKWKCIKESRRKVVSHFQEFDLLWFCTAFVCVWRKQQNGI